MPGISPSRREIDSKRACRFTFTVQNAGNHGISDKMGGKVYLISLLEGEMSGRTEGGKRHINSFASCTLVAGSMI
ncbi:hypothetical protein FS763_13995 [Agrobacterium vitis]|nr:hypothetical protein [Allorhizobium ampelinum]